MWQQRALNQDLTLAAPLSQCRPPSRVQVSELELSVFSVFQPEKLDFAYCDCDCVHCAGPRDFVEGGHTRKAFVDSMLKAEQVWRDLKQIQRILFISIHILVFKECHS